MESQWRPKWQNFGKRDWDSMRESWLSQIPLFPGLGAPPDPGLEALTTLRAVSLPPNHERVPDVDGLRMNALWEAVFLFHKCAHTHLASQRMGQMGMHNWCLFNAYHSAYLGAKGTMTLLGVPLPNIGGSQIGIDLFPESLKPKKRSIVSPLFQEFLIVRLPMLEQRRLWEGFQRILRMSDVKCWDIELRDELTGLPFEGITPPRNHYLYKARYWPLPDLLTDQAAVELDVLKGTNLDVGEKGFLLRLCFSVYRLFEQLMNDLAQSSAVIKQQIDASRIVSSAGLPVISSYADFVTETSEKREAL